MRQYLFFVLALAVTACGSDDREVGPVPFKAPRSDERGPMMGSLDRVAIEQARSGDCASAIPLLRCFAYRGRGNEMAQSALGTCLVRGARAGDSNWNQGVTWLRRAGDTGFPEAQSDLIQTLAQSSSSDDVVEAQTWRIIYERGRSTPYPPQPLAKDVTNKLDARLTPSLRSEAELKASSWSYRFWVMQPGDVADAKAAMAQCPKPAMVRRGDRRRNRNFDQPTN